MSTRTVNERVEWDASEVQRVSFLASQPPVVEVLTRVGERIAEVSRGLAPKRTGRGAASIESRLKHHPKFGLYAEVGWDRDHFYMGFHELGTVKMPARPFLRPAAQQVTGQVGVNNTYTV